MNLFPERNNDKIHVLIQALSNIEKIHLVQRLMEHLREQSTDLLEKAFEGINFLTEEEVARINRECKFPEETVRKIQDLIEKYQSR